MDLDVVEFTEAGSTYRVFGLQAKAQQISAAAMEVETAIGDRIEAASKALMEWRGVHAVTFGEDVNGVLAKMEALRSTLSRASRVLSSFPDPAGGGLAWLRGLFDRPRVDVPERSTTASAVPSDLRDYAALASLQDLRLGTFDTVVNLKGVTAEVTVARPLGAVDRQRLLDAGWPLGMINAETAAVTSPVGDLTALIPLPDPTDEVADFTAASVHVGEFVTVVAIAFETDNRGLLHLLAEHPELAAGALDFLQDGKVDTAAGALAILQTHWDTFDTAGDGGDPDGIVSHKDIRAIMEHPEDYSPAAVAAATFLEHNRRFFNLLETTNGGGHDSKISKDDLDLFIESSTHLRTLNENFDAFDTAAHGGSPDGRISVNDLEAMAEGTGPEAEAAQWLLDHDAQRDRLAGYELYLAAGVMIAGPGLITRPSVIGMTVDQQVYGPYDPSRLNLPPGTIPPPPPQPYIDRGAAGEFNQDPDWSTADDYAHEAKMQAVADAAEAAGETDAARHMRHYLDASGDDLILDADRIMREVDPLTADVNDTVAGEIDRIVQTGQYDQAIHFGTDWNAFNFYGADDNWFHAIGAVQYSVTGVAIVHPPTAAGGQPTVEVDYQVHLYDRYNWDEGDDPATTDDLTTPELTDPEDPKGVELPGLGWVPDEEQAELQRAGLAREFDMRGSSDAFHYSGAPPTAPNVPEPPGGRGGRDDPGRTRD